MRAQGCQQGGGAANLGHARLVEFRVEVALPAAGGVPGRTAVPEEHDAAVAPLPSRDARVAGQDALARLLAPPEPWRTSWGSGTIGQSFHSRSRA